jgi:two-component system LytT family response regulator
MIKAVIIDDEPYACEVLVTLLQRHCPEVEVMAVFTNAKEAVKQLTALQPSLVFLDIEMPHMNGFQLLEKIRPIGFEIIFTTSYDQYAIKAIRVSALDYLLKPVDAEELKSAIQKYKARVVSTIPEQLDILLSKLRQPVSEFKRIALPTMEGLQIISVDNIILCSSSSNYTILRLKGNQALTISRTLKEIEEMLEGYSFLRVHHSFLVNLNEVKKYIRGEGGNLIMSDGSSADVSRSKKESLLKRLQAGK